MKTKQININDYVYVNGEGDRIYVVIGVHKSGFSLMTLNGEGHGSESIEKVTHWEDELKRFFSQFLNSEFHDPDVVSLNRMADQIGFLSQLGIPKFKEKILEIFQERLSI